MSERILKALMQLFAIIAKVDMEEVDGGGFKISGGGRDIVRLFLRQELNQELVNEYIKLFDEYLTVHQGKSKKKDSGRKRTSVNSVKVLRICTQINEELTQKQKLIVLIRILEFIYANDEVAEQELEFATTVAETFNISREEFTRCKDFVELNTDKLIDDAHWMFVDAITDSALDQAHHLYSESIEGRIVIIRIESVNIYFMRYQGKSDLYLNGQVLPPNRNFILNQGSSIRSSRVKPIYYSDIIGRFLSDDSTAKINFKTDGIQYHFKGGKVGLHPINFSEDSGKLIGIMGGSGAGKSTLLNVLNGNYTPTIGAVTINGVDIHRETDDIEGLIGYVSQDDLLIEELTVFQNLFFNAKLCFGNLSDSKISLMVMDTLNAIGLSEAKNLKVGSPLEKTISGGQRKRLNIALELIREPSVMFVDEPTSGLSSRDSENIMDLLKELALKGKLIFVVIHQPSSDIFKMFDTLLILDQGGFPIYNGNPVDAVVYFKKLVSHVNAEESECHSCGNVNPEQIFNIIESKVVDEYGNLTGNRKVSPKEWNNNYKELIDNTELPATVKENIPESEFKVPSIWKQFMVFFKRDVLSKLTNTQYLLINSIEAPALAAILAFFMKYFNNTEIGEEYVFRYSENIPQYLFISVIVALFIGLTVSAEEIIGNRKILKREEFLNLSRGSYLASKISIMFVISAIQTLLFVLVGNFILEIRGMIIPYWIIMFSTSCFANMLGLNISSSFNSAKVIYILIPILIIPQLLFSGIIVSFDKLNPMFKSESHVPWIGNVMASRWAYEALAVYQFKNNEFEKDYYLYDKEMKFSNWKKDQWAQAMENKVNYVHKYYLDSADSPNIQEGIDLIIREFQKEQRRLAKDSRIEVKPEFDFLSTLKDAKTFNEEIYLDLRGSIVTIEEIYKWLFNYYENLSDDIAVAAKTPSTEFLDDLDRKLTAGTITKKEFRSLKKAERNRLGAINSDLQKIYTNEALEKFVTNDNSFEYIVEAEGQLIQKSDPIYLDPYDNYFMRSHFYSPRKMFFGSYLSTFVFNTMMIWLMSVILIIALYFDLLRRIIEGSGKLFSKIIPSSKN
ncbi:MAG: ATP-binding cassette domain-containing protein [Crocinitomicaceae bacterium]|nr:ATP-binding cassette domain-containing protein [Crocinitomicaceae bacterium]